MHILFYIGRRIVWGLFTLWIIVTITFMLMHSIPGGPFDQDALESMNEIVRRNMEAKFGLDKPYLQQYGIYLGNLMKGEMGISIAYAPRTVQQIIGRGLPVSAQLGLSAAAVAVSAGIILGSAAALRRGRWQDTTIKVLTTIGITVPSFVLATMLIYVFAVKLRILPSFGFRSIRHMILPTVALSFGSIAYIARLTRSSMLDVIKQDYVRTAKAKGLPRRTVVFKHALKNALLPIVTYVGPLIAVMLTGSFVVEKIFAVPGIGREMVGAIANRDYIMILGLTTFFSIIMISTYIIVDIIYIFIDPRVNFD